MRTCGNCVYWTGRPRKYDVAECSLNYFEITGRLKESKLMAVDAQACEHWKPSTKRYAYELHRPRFKRCNECVYWLGGDNDMTAPCKMNENDPITKDKLYNRMRKACPKMKIRGEKNEPEKV